MLFSLPDTYKAGYEFISWHVGSLSGAMLSLPYTLSADVTLVAEWRLETYGTGNAGNTSGTGGGSAGSNAAQNQVPKSKVATLKNLKTKGAKLKKTFKPVRTSYSVTLPARKKKVTITPKATDAKATLYIKVGNGTYKQASGIKVGVRRGKKMVVRIKVVAEDTTVSKVYKITLKRK